MKLHLVPAVIGLVALAAIVQEDREMIVLHPAPRGGVIGVDIRKLRFRSECVHMEILPNQMTVTASYGFKVMSPDTLRMVLKFPQDSTMGIPQLLNARIRFGDHRRKSLKVDTKQLPWEWLVPSTKEDSLRIELEWEQALSSSRARYRLTAAKSWWQRLEHVRVEVEMPRDVGHPTFSLPMVEEKSEDKSITYVWEGRDVWPEEDLRITW